MIRRVFLASVVAGAVAGIALTAFQLGAVTPLLFAAESYEAGDASPAPTPHAHGELTHSHAAGERPHVHDGHAVIFGDDATAPAVGDTGDTSTVAPPDPGDAARHDGHAHDHGGAWAPADGIERTFWTAVSNVATAIGFALILVAVLAWRGNATWRQGLFWGAAGFFVFFLNPAIGLRPEIPGAFAGVCSTASSGGCSRSRAPRREWVCCSSRQGPSRRRAAPFSLSCPTSPGRPILSSRLRGDSHRPGSRIRSSSPRPPRTGPSGCCSGSWRPPPSPDSRGAEPGPRQNARAAFAMIADPHPMATPEPGSEEALNRRANEKARKRKAVRDRILATKTIEKGLLIVHTGKGKGKSTAAFGLVARAIGNGFRVGVVQYVKGKWQTGERTVLERFPDQVDIRTMGEGFTWETQDRARDIRAAQAAWETSKEMIEACRGDDPALRPHPARRAQHRAPLQLPAARRGLRVPRARSPRPCTSS